MDINALTSRVTREVLNERIKTRDEYASSDKKEAKRLFKQLIGIMNRCDDPNAKKMVERLSSLAGKLDGVDFSTFKRRYNYVTAQRRKEDNETFNSGFNAALDQLDEDGWFNDTIKESKMKKVQLTENDLHNMVREAVYKLRESFYGFDESGDGSSSDEGPKSDDDGRPDDSSSEDAQRKRSVVLDTLRNTRDDYSDVKRRNFIYKLYNISDKDDYDTYRSLFSKCLNPKDSAHQFSDAQINTLYNMLSNVM